MKKIYFYKLKKINLKKKHNIFYITGNNYINKNICKKYIKKLLSLYINKNNIINLIIDNKYNWNKIKNIIINQNLFSKKKLLIINIIEKNKNINNYIYKYIIKNIIKKNIIYIIIFFEYNNLNKIYFKKKIKKILIIKCNKKYINNKKTIFYYKNINYNYIKNIIMLIYKKKIEKILYIINKIKYENHTKIIILNILFKYFIKNIYKYKKIESKKILYLIKKNEINIKKNKKINLIYLKLLILIIIDKKKIKYIFNNIKYLIY